MGGERGRVGGGRGLRVAYRDITKMFGEKLLLEENGFIRGVGDCIS
jgi:hypothetical protein